VVNPAPGGGTSNSATLTVTSAGSVPAAPSNLTAFAPSATQVNLNWIDNSNNESGFKIISVGGNGSFVLATVGPNVTSYADTACPPVASSVTR
jgi:hypothetical protein